MRPTHQPTATRARFRLALASLAFTTSVLNAAAFATPRPRPDSRAQVRRPITADAKGKRPITADAKGGRPITADAKNRPSDLTALAVHPAAVQLSGARARQQLRVTATYANGATRDLTRSARYTAAAPFAVSRTGWVTPRADGRGVLIVQVGAQRVPVPVTVFGAKSPPQTTRKAGTR